VEGNVNKQQKRYLVSMVIGPVKRVILTLYWWLVSVYLTWTVNSPDMEDFMDENEEIVDNRPTHTLIPALRVYIGAITPDGDWVDVEELEQWLSQKGPKQTVVDLLNDGMGSIFAVDHHKEEKVL
jgi:hypothetical protein